MLTLKHDKSYKLFPPAVFPDSSDSVQENKAFLYNPVIMPTMTSEKKNHPHNQKYVTQSQWNSIGPL